MSDRPMQRLRQYDGAPRTAADFRELARLNHTGTHSCTGVCLAEVVAAFGAEAAAPAGLDGLLEAVSDTLNDSPGMHVAEYEGGSMIGRQHAINIVQDAIREWLAHEGSPAGSLDSKWLAQAISNVMGDRMVNGADLRQADDIVAEYARLLRGKRDE